MTGTSISHVEAQQMYYELVSRAWNVDSYRGTYSALQVLVADEFARRMHRENLRSGGRRTRPDKPIPAWVAPAWEDLKRSVAGLVDLHAATKAMSTLPSEGRRLTVFAEACFPGPQRELVEGLLLKGKVPGVFALPLSAPEHQRSQADLARIEAHFAELNPRDFSELRAFFDGTRTEFHALGHGEPTAKVLALLCAARGIEPITDGMNKARKKWDERLGRWRREMDADTPAWRTDAIAWDGIGYEP